MYSGALRLYVLLAGFPFERAGWNQLSYESKLLHAERLHTTAECPFGPLSDQLLKFPPLFVAVFIFIPPRRREQL